MRPNRTVETLDGLEIPVDRVVSFSTCMLSVFSGPVLVKMMVLTDKLGEAQEKVLKLGFPDLDSATTYMNAILNPKEVEDVRSSKLLPIW